MISDEQITQAVGQYGDMLYRLAVITLKNTADAEDAVSDTFLAYMTKAPDFADKSHEKAWLITVVLNRCRDILRKRKRIIPDSGELLLTLPQPPEENSVLEALMTLPEKQRTAMTLHYVNGCRIAEISHILGISTSAVKMRLHKGRQLLEKALDN
ncbi:MAG: RNA polymerase sigma factor [Ruminococcus sp.]|nr:RNA polymerase sigma factor [Ruminococcus sp.]